MIINIFSSVLLNCSVKLLFDLWQLFNLSSNIMLSILDFSLLAFLSLSSLLLPHKAPQNLFLLHSSFRDFFVSHSSASTTIMLISFSSSHSLLILVDAILPRKGPVTRAMSKRLNEDWARAVEEGPRVLMNLRVDFWAHGPRLGPIIFVHIRLGCYYIWSLYLGLYNVGRVP